MTETSGATSTCDEVLDGAGTTTRMVLILGVLLGFTSISTDFYLPALPAMAASLRVGPGTVELTISAFLVGFSLGQLLWGPVGDRVGRRAPVAVGLVLFAAGSAGCALADGAPALLAWRVVQAFGACASVVLARAMVRDIHAGRRAAQMLSTLMTVTFVAPLVGPVAGGQILVLAGWRAIFWTLVGVGLLALVSLALLPETLPEERRSREPLPRAFRRYGALLRERRIMVPAGAGCFFYAGLFAYVAGTPFAYITYHHLPPRLYGLVFGVGILGIMVTNFANARLVHRLGSERLLLWGSAAAALSGLAIVATAFGDLGGLAGLVLPVSVFIGATGFIVANSIVGALADFPERAGAVSALVGALQYGSGIVGASLVGALADGTPRPMAVVIALGGLGSLACAGRLTRTA